jgi:uncharacterized repeat protein (TIGR01451 family)
MYRHPLPVSGMEKSTRPFGALGRALGAALCALACVFAYARADAQGALRTISNIAEIEWDEGAFHLRQSSNRVDIAVDAPPSAPTYAATAYRFDSGSGSVALPLARSACRGNAGAVPAPLNAAWQSEPLSPARATPVEQVRAGEPLLIQLDYPAANLDSGAIDSITVIALAKSGDRETLSVAETGPNTGKFAGYIQTAAAPRSYVQGDCRLDVQTGDRILLESPRPGAQPPLVFVELAVLADPAGIVFDSQDGKPVDGARITLIDDATGLPAQVLGEAGNASYPSTVVSGQPIQDASGTASLPASGGYRFPVVRPGRYRLVIEAPQGYVAPSARSAAELAALRQPDGKPFEIAAGSFGAPFLLTGPDPVQIAIPLDRLGAPIQLEQKATRTEAAPGETVGYAITLRNANTLPTAAIALTDRASPALRMRPETVRLNGRAVAARATVDGIGFDLDLPPLAAGGSALVTYGMQVQGDAGSGEIVNRASVRDSRGAVTGSSTADAVLRIRRDAIADRVTIEGRLTDGGCGPAERGIAGVRIMIEDGSYAVTDGDGRYHFEGLTSGTHIVQMDESTLPADRAAIDCNPDTRSGGRAFSRFVDGRGGDLKRVDFHAAPSESRTSRAAIAHPRAAALSDAAAAGADRDWLAGEKPGLAWLFPQDEHNPRAPIVRVAIKHLPGQAVKLFAAGKPVDAIAYEGEQKSADGEVVVSLWRGVSIESGATELSAEVRDAGGRLVQTLRRIVRYGASPMQATLLRDRSILVADGVTRPVLAVRFTDRDGRPVRHGLVGDFEVPAPYYPAVEADAQQARQLAGLERARPFWRIEGDDGVAYIELEPTTASGSVSLRFAFRDGQASREQRLEAWLDPGDRPWTIVGLAEGTVGFNRLNNRLEALGDDPDTLLTDGRLALYAKGRVRGKWLMTLAYDSDKKRDETRFGGAIDPSSYYTVYADQSERRYDAASVKKLYLKLERPQFYALFGDFQTGIDEPQLARYVRAFTGAKAEYRSLRIAALAFAADAPNRHRRDDIQGSGLSGPYALGARNILANSERITIEVRDRLRSDRIVETRLLARYVDYNIDYPAGTIRFKQPVLSRDSDLDPQFIVAEYEVEGVASGSLNAGGRVALRTADQKLQVAATALHDADDRGATDLAGADLRYRPNATTELRAEVAVSDNRPRAGSSQAAAGTAVAWLAEAEHHGARYDLLAYARQQDPGFGLGQLGGAENGTRKLGFDGRVKIAATLSLAASGWIEDYLDTDARRVAARALLEYRGSTLSGRAGFTFADDRLADGRTARSTLLQLGATRRLLRNRLELDAQTEIPIGGQDGSVDFPAQHRFTARYQVNSGVQLVGAYEIADGKQLDARTARVGFDIQPWAGAKIALTANRQDIAEYGPRSFAAFGLSQSLVLGKHWSVDLTLDSNETLSGIDPSRVLNPLQPVASGGFTGNGAMTEDFTAVTAGTTYRTGPWSMTARAEYRAGSRGDRYGVTAAALRQIGEGRALGAALDWFTAKGPAGAETRTGNLQLSWANRPAASAWSWLEKLELREDRVTGAVAGAPDPLGAPFAIGGDARSRRVVNTLSIDYASKAGTEISLFWGSRYVADRIGADDVGGWSNLVGADLRLDLSSTLDISLAASLREGAGARSFGYALGPSLGFKPFVNGWLSVGVNLVGFHDRDFEADRYTRAGPYVTMRLKFDQLSLAGLGLGALR